jgi:hypothetical protein
MMLKIETKLSLQELVDSQNIAEELSAEELTSIGNCAAEGFAADLQSPRTVGGADD